MTEIRRNSPVDKDTRDRYEFTLQQFRALGASANEAIRNGSVAMEIKPDGTPVTNIDKEIEARFTEAVEQRYGSDGDVVLGEEFSVDQQVPDDRRVWRVDPLDGTGWLTRLMKQGDAADYDTLRATMLAAHFTPGETTPAFGVTHSPFFGNEATSMTAIDGQALHHHADGAVHVVTVNPQAPVNLRDITRYERNGLSRPIQDVGLGAMREIMPNARRVELPLFLGNIGLHNVDISVHPGSSQPHDIAAGALAVVNAGGTVKTFDGDGFEDVDWRKYPINGIVAGSNESLVDQVVAHYLTRQ